MNIEPDLRAKLKNNQRTIFFTEANELLAAWQFQRKSAPKRSKNMSMVPAQWRYSAPPSEKSPLMPCHVSYHRVGFFIVGIGFPLIHLFIVLEHFRPAFIHKYKRVMNQGAIAMVILLISAGFIGSSWIKTQVENAGYYYCRQAGGAGAFSRTLVYTRDAAVCEDLAVARLNRK
jgi:hypothetical protein